MLPRLLGPFALLLTSSAFAQKPIEITFLHTNDLHAHVEPTAVRGKPFGGYARVATLVKAERKKTKNVVLLNAGDTFQGTLYFNVYDGLADAALMNLTGYDAMALGNHEFDRGPDLAAGFARAANFPVLGANVEFSDRNSALSKAIRRSTILTVGGQRVGIIGVVTKDTPNISSPGADLNFREPLEAAQEEADLLTKQGVNKIVVVSHIGYEEDQKLAKGLRNVDLIVGGHSHTPLGTPNLEGWRAAQGPYPTLVRDLDGRDVPIVQSWEWGKVLGRIRLAFDARGRLTKVVAAEPIPVGEEIVPDPEVQALTDAFAKPIAAVIAAPVGTAAVEIQDRTLLGHHIADALLEGGKAGGAVAAFMNPGGVRASLDKGTITYGTASSIVPFRNTLILLDLTGAEIETALGQARLIPSAGTSYRLVDGKPTDIVVAGEPLDRAKTYRIATINFLAGGGDSVFAFRDAKGTRTDTGALDLDLWLAYLKARSPLTLPESRIR